MKKITVVILFLTILKIKAQTNQIGIGLIELNSFNQKIKNADTSVITTAKNTLVLRPIISFNHTNKNDIDFGVQFGYFKENTKVFQKGVYADKSVNYSYATTNKESIYLKLGLSKKISFEKFYFLLGVQIPISVNYKNYYKNDNTINDSLGKFVQFRFSDNNLPNTYYTGILLNIGLFYKLYKFIYIGGEINYGLYYSLQYGKRIYSNNTIDSWNNSYYDKKELNYNISQIQLGLNPTIHLRFMLPSKKKMGNPISN